MLRFSLFVLLPLLAYTESNSGSWTFSLQRYEGSRTTHGSLVATRGDVTGLVCDDSFDDQTAEYLCRKMGFGRAKGWATWEDVSSEERVSESLAYELDFALDDFDCSGTSGDFESDCDYVTTENCGVLSESVVLDCELGNGIVAGKGKYQLADNAEAAGVGNAVFALEDEDGELRSTLVCAPGPRGSGYPKEVLDMICRQSGYVTSRRSTIHRLAASSDRVNCHWAGEKNVGTVTLDIADCAEGAESSDQCELTVKRNAIGGCNIDNTVVVHCASDYLDILSFQVLANPEGGLDGIITGPKYAAQKGTVVATLTDKETGETHYSLVKGGGDEAQLQKTANAICIHLGYRSGTYSPQRDMAPTTRISCGFVEEMGIETLISGYSCPTGETDVKNCSYSTGEEGWDAEEAMAVECKGKSGPIRPF